MRGENQDKERKRLDCPHSDIEQKDGLSVCQNCGLILKEGIYFIHDNYSSENFYNTQRNYERDIRIKDSMATQNPKIKQNYDKIQVIDKWFKDSKTNFGEQKKTLDLLKSYNIGFNVDKVKFQQIKDRYIRYNRKFKKSYQNMVIIFLTIIWMEVKDITNIRLEEYITICNELGHKINKKMLNNAMLKVLKSENQWNKKPVKVKELERDIKNKIKILFQKNLNNISFESINELIVDKEEFSRLKIEMQLILDKILKKIDYEQIKNLNYKAFTAGLIYFISQTLKSEHRKIFIQSLIEKVTKFSSTTIRKKYHILIDILGKPGKLNIHQSE
ncbi:MAG: hypothetical protein KGD63_11400 [Candidatus Lokiarchaeota archaeon]|nr:hypothetical protein [Candidatus Lokiarchaeota archaeon]